MVLRARVDDDPAMQVVHARQARRLNTRLSLLTGALTGLLLVGLAATLAYVAIATPFAGQFMPHGSSDTASMLVNAVAWTLLLTAPAIAGIAGLARLAGVADRGLAGRRRSDPMTVLGRVLGPEYAAATGVHLPDGRVVAEVIVGPHGVAVFEPLPPRAFFRQHGNAWELRVGKDRWIPQENPFERATRTADRVRHWLGTDDRDFVVKVYVAVITSDTSLARTATCAVIARDQVAAYLASLPVQRTFSTERRAQVFELLRSAA
jgi:hypothetical protein